MPPSPASTPSFRGHIRKKPCLHRAQTARRCWRRKAVFSFTPSIVDERFDEALFKAGLARLSRTDIAEREAAPSGRQNASRPRAIHPGPPENYALAVRFRKPSERYCGFAKVWTTRPRVSPKPFQPEVAGWRRSGRKQADL
jgi:hypothetical protein